MHGNACVYAEILCAIIISRTIIEKRTEPRTELEKNAAATNSETHTANCMHVRLTGVNDRINAFNTLEYYTRYLFLCHSLSRFLSLTLCHCLPQCNAMQYTIQIYCVKWSSSRVLLTNKMCPIFIAEQRLLQTNIYDYYERSFSLSLSLRSREIDMYSVFGGLLLQRYCKRNWLASSHLGSWTSIREHLFFFSICCTLNPCTIFFFLSVATNSK